MVSLLSCRTGNRLFLGEGRELVWDHSLWFWGDVLTEGVHRKQQDKLLTNAASSASSNADAPAELLTAPLPTSFPNSLSLHLGSAVADDGCAAGDTVRHLVTDGDLVVLRPPPLLLLLPL